MTRISRRDFGFVVAKILALVAWKSAASLLAYSIFMSYIDLKYRGEAGVFNDQLLGTLPGLVIAVVAGYVGVQLWFRADRFGVTDVDPQPDPGVALSRDVLIQGLAIGAAIVMLIPVVPYFGSALAWVLADDPSRGRIRFETRDLLADGVSAAFAVGLLVWAYRSTNPRIKAPLEEVE